MHFEVGSIPAINGSKMRSTELFFQIQALRGRGFDPAQVLNFFRSLSVLVVIAAALALMTVITQLLLMDKMNFTLSRDCFKILDSVPTKFYEIYAHIMGN